MHGTFHANSTIARETRVNIGKARLYQRREPGVPLSPGQLREREILKVVNHIFGTVALPDDDFGRDVLFEVLNQLALNGATQDELRAYGRDLLPEVDDDDSLDDMVKSIRLGRKRGADDIARRFGVDYQMRTLLDLRTIGACDVTTAERAKIQRQKEAADKRWKRELAGAKPQAKSERRNKPWELRGISESTYRREKRAAKNAANDTANDDVTALRPSYSSLSSLTKCGHPTTEPPVDPRPRFERDVPAGPQLPSHCQASSLDQPQESQAVVSETPAVHAAEPIPAATRLREAHFERNQLLKLEPLDAEQGRRLIELGRIIETARHKLEQRASRGAAARCGGGGMSPWNCDGDYPAVEKPSRSRLSKSSNQGGRQ